ncbi:MAG: tRNA glutamyl-Q(34) synthetase GluQRS [Planctomycetes bacterium]|nr:tRNA glutamyl-Q(34) synthetase GluQRS [Planctomycetota bacterium]
MTTPSARATEITGRLAPSPTGHLHLGHARSFLLAWWHARARGGRIVLRIEDLDTERVKPGMIEATLADLRWLGLDWDGEPHVQSAGEARIAAAAAALVARGLAYPCTCTRAEIAAAASAPHVGESGPRYPGTCRGRWPSVESAQSATGRAPALRFVVREGPIEIEDGLHGRLAFDVARAAGDFPIYRRAGSPAYQLAVVVDDAWQAVTEVVRGEDLLESAARQALLQEALGLPRPRWWHVPLVTDEHGRRLAKRSDDLSLASLRERGVDPRAVVGWVARRSGLKSARDAWPAGLVREFALDRIPRTPVAAGPLEIAELAAG